MADLRIKGDVSGYVDLVAPDVAGSTTIDLSKVLVADSNGNVGIGTSSPGRLLTLFNDDQPVFQITNNTSGSASTNGMIFYQASGSTNHNIDNQGSGSGGDIQFMSAGSNTLKIQANGNVGIGTTNPAVPLTVSTTSNESLRLDASDGQQTTIGFAQNNNVRWLIGNDLFANGGNGFFVYNEDLAITRIYADGSANGFVGIGNVTNPSTQLDVDGANNKTSLHLRSGDNNTASGGGNQITLGYDGSTNYRHNIKTRHDSINISNNLFDFYVWQPTQSASDNGNRHVARFDGYGVTTPNSPAFEASTSGVSNQSFSGGAEHKIIFNAAAHNRGGHYSTSNYRFTAPIAGFYHFSTCFQINNIDSTSWAWNLQLRRNGTHKAGVYTGTSSVGYEGGTTAATLYLSAGDYVEAWARFNTSAVIEYSAPDGRFQFSGFLVG